MLTYCANRQQNKGDKGKDFWLVRLKIRFVVERLRTGVKGFETNISNKERLSIRDSGRTDANEAVQTNSMEAANTSCVFLFWVFYKYSLV